MTADEYDQWKVFSEMFVCEASRTMKEYGPGRNAYYDALHFLGIALGDTHNWEPLEPDIAKKLEMLAGPHGYTVMKAMEAQREEKRARV